MNEIYESTVLVRSSEVDAQSCIRPSALLGFFQDAATEHAALTGADRDSLIASCGGFWMLARVWYGLARPIRMDERLTVRTWQRSQDRLMVYRDFDLLVGDEPVGEGVSAWVVAELESRRLLRPAEIPCIAGAPRPEAGKTRTLKLIRAPKEKTAVYDKTVRWSDLDLNGHMNNTKYADAAMDALSLETLRGGFLSEMQINYSMECAPGEMMTVSRSPLEDGWYVDGCGGDGVRRFEALLKFRPV